MILTVRPTEEEASTIEKAAKLLGIKSMSKTVITACSETLRLNDRVKELESQLSKQRNRADSAERAIRNVQQANKALDTYKVTAS
jgi:cell division protein FtsL